MTIKVLNPAKHLTATEKKAIQAILIAGLQAGQVGRKVYRLAAISENTYRVSISENRSDDYGVSKEITYSVDVLAA